MQKTARQQTGAGRTAIQTAHQKDCPDACRSPEESNACCYPLPMLLLSRRTAVATAGRYHTDCSWKQEEHSRALRQTQWPDRAQHRVQAKKKRWGTWKTWNREDQDKRDADAACRLVFRTAAGQKSGGVLLQIRKSGLEYGAVGRMEGQFLVAEGTTMLYNSARRLQNRPRRIKWFRKLEKRGRRGSAARQERNGDCRRERLLQSVQSGMKPAEPDI